MQETITSLGNLVLVGTEVRTSNAKEGNPDTAKIGPHFYQYISQQTAEKIDGRLAPYTTYSVYTKYESNEHGEYTHFLGESVDPSSKQTHNDLIKLEIPASKYKKFTTNEGPMPGIVIEAWQKIWAMTPEELGGKRTYIADFEVYDQRSADPAHAVVDIYVGIVS